MIGLSRIRYFTVVTAFAVTVAWPHQSFAIKVYTSDGAGLDGQARESADAATGMITTNDFSGTGTAINVRYVGYNNGFPFGVPAPEGDTDDDSRNEFIVLRFDLSGVEDKSLITGATINLTHFRNRQPNILRVWGVNPGTQAVDTFDEASATMFGDVPGLIQDNDMTTQGVDPGVTTFLGDAYPPPTPDDPENRLLKGSQVTISQDLLLNTGPNEDSVHGDGGVLPQATLDGFLRALGEHDLVMFLLGGYDSNEVFPNPLNPFEPLEVLQFRMATKESTSLDGSDPLCGEGGINCTPFLEFELAAAGLPGDYNASGAVDAADYVLWRNGGPLQNDSTAGVQPEDYNVWRANFGKTAGSGQALPSAEPLPAGVPEPASAMLLILGGVIAQTVCRRRV